jgi:predicted enzyme related to lactoylglutathione lyase
VGCPATETSIVEGALSLLPKPSVVVFVADVPGMTRFYQTVASMVLVFSDADHAVLELEGVQVVIHALRGEPNPAPGGQVRVREDSYIKLCLPVHSIAAARSLAADLGGSIQPPAKEWEARGFRACDGNDPEGNVFQVRQPLESSNSVTYA